MGNLTVSKYLQVVPRKNDFAIYHSLFGDLRLIDAEGKRLLEAFESPDSIENVTGRFAGYDPLSIWSYINDLRSSGFLVEEESDEYGIIERDRRRREHYLSSGYLIRVLQLVLTNRCNFKCKYCFVNSMYDSREREYLQRAPENMNMSFETAERAVKALIDLCEKNGNRLLNVEFFGGEPMMNLPVIEKVLETFGGRSPGGVSISYSTTTNGWFITPGAAEMFKKHGVTVTVSFDSPGCDESVSLGMEKGGKKVRENLAILRDTGNWITFNSVICKENLDSYDGRRLVDDAKQFGVGMIGLILDLDLRFYKDPANKRRIVDALWETCRYGKEQGVPVVGYWQQLFRQITGQQPINLVSGYKTCPAAGCKLSVEPAGDVFICKCCSGRLGHISDLDKVIDSPGYREYAMQAYLNAPGCAGCEIEGFCSGVCMGALEKKYNKLDVVEKSTCEIYREITRKLIENMGREEARVNYLSDHPAEMMQYG